MKAVIKILALLFLMSFSVKAQWFWQNPLPQGNTLNSVDFINSNTGWAVGGYGTILKTTNGGTNWTSQTSGTSNTLCSVNFVDQNTGWAVGESGTILKTTNGGTNWISQTSGTTNTLFSVNFVDQNTGWAVGRVEQSLRQQMEEQIGYRRQAVRLNH